MMGLSSKIKRKKLKMSFISLISTATTFSILISISTLIYISFIELGVYENALRSIGMSMLWINFLWILSFIFFKMICEKLLD